jgi:hypothetical protein
LNTLSISLDLFRDIELGGFPIRLAKTQHLDKQRDSEKKEKRHSKELREKRPNPVAPPRGLRASLDHPTWWLVPPGAHHGQGHEKTAQYCP